MAFTPSKQILENYAKVMIDFALGNTKGINKGDVVLVQYQVPSKPLAIEIYKRVLQNGAHPILRPYDEDFSKVFYENANDEQLEFFPEKYTKSLVDTIDHRIFVISDADPLLLKDVDPKKIVLANKNTKKYRKWLNDKEDAGKLSWTLCLYGTEGMAKEANLSIEEYWEQIINACHLREGDPVAKWKEVIGEVSETIDNLNKLEIEAIHLISDRTDMRLKLGKDRKFVGGRGNNIPSFEIFTSPDWRGTEGKIFFDYPLYRYGSILKDIALEFKEGKIVKASAGENEKLLKEMIAQENADKVGEFSLTDRRFSKITKFMAETLYDENYGGEYGNTHLAIGSSYHDTYRGDSKNFTAKDWEDLGFNESPEHCDIIATAPREVYATLPNGKEVLIYKDGEFVI